MMLKNIAVISLLASAFLSSPINAAEVRSISREVKSSFDGDSIWTVYVKCAGVTEERAIERVSKNAKWCAEDLPTLCGRKKVKVANKVCGTHFERLVLEHRFENGQEEIIADDQ